MSFLLLFLLPNIMADVHTCHSSLTNVIIILADDLGYGDLGRTVRTPEYQSIVQLRDISF